MSVSSIKLSVACLLLLGVALIFVSEGAEALWEEMDDSPDDLDMYGGGVYDSESDTALSRRIDCIC
ncbi:MAG: hypothetical protein QGF98_06075 [Candidatus Poseidoniia archaeon]|nr:hypothetical protein [Candidatus Poseidoniia archaeon]